MKDFTNYLSLGDLMTLGEEKPLAIPMAHAIRRIEAAKEKFQSWFHKAERGDKFVYYFGSLAHDVDTLRQEGCYGGKTKKLHHELLAYQQYLLGHAQFYDSTKRPLPFKRLDKMGKGVKTTSAGTSYSYDNAKILLVQKKIDDILNANGKKLRQRNEYIAIKL
tara:strand:- start:31 stop:519 length:489 start_codon:yes stop_codon:yes gene_type:complete